MNYTKRLLLSMAGVISITSCSSVTDDVPENPTQTLQISAGVNGIVDAVEVKEIDNWLFPDSSDQSVTCAAGYEELQLSPTVDAPDKILVSGREVEFSYISRDWGDGFEFSTGDLPSVAAVIFASGGIVHGEEAAVSWPQTTNKVEILVEQRRWINSASLCIR
ncbi:hypothetical protein [Rhodococcus sp. BS-15]|uniref:hypothetical protein n=1 Tax=Rhodococcus sp. BS-15 TaxID=1304954 RepID=UPI000FFB920A|nr:hypothetical protein [Rhodococcus sp. BS-15]